MIKIKKRSKFCIQLRRGPIRVFFCLEFQRIRRVSYLGDDLAGAEPCGLVGGGCGSDEEPEEEVEELVGVGGGIAGGGEGGDEGDGAFGGGEPPLEIEERG